MSHRLCKFSLGDKRWHHIGQQSVLRVMCIVVSAQTLLHYPQHQDHQLHWIEHGGVLQCHRLVHRTWRTLLVVLSLIWISLSKGLGWWWGFLDSSFGHQFCKGFCLHVPLLYGAMHWMVGPSWISWLVSPSAYVFNQRCSCATWSGGTMWLWMCITTYCFDASDNEACRLSDIGNSRFAWGYIEKILLPVDNLSVATSWVNVLQSTFPMWTKAREFGRWRPFSSSSEPLSLNTPSW